MKIKVAVAEDNPNLARAIRENLASFEDVELLFVAGNGMDAIQKMSSALPDVILMDIHMPVMDGIEATRRINHLFPQVKIIMLTVFDDSDKIFDSIMAGATGYLLKDETPGKILAALEEAMEGGAPMSSLIASKSLQLIKRGTSSPTPEKRDYNLSEREVEILELIAKGENYQEIADKLFISPKTVRKHIENIYRKLQVHNKVDAVKLALGIKNP